MWRSGHRASWSIPQGRGSWAGISGACASELWLENPAPAGQHERCYVRRVPHAQEPPGLDRPDDDAVVGTTRALAWQAQYCCRAGSPVAAAILDAVRRDVEGGGPLAEALPSSVRFGDLVGLRVMAAVHRLALLRRATWVAMCLPTLGGTPPVPGTDSARRLAADVVATLEANDGMLAAMLECTPQTNEVGRAAPLRVALSWLGAERPLRLREIGASAGLNLRADLLPGSPKLEFGELPVVVDRRGCDLHPVDPTTPTGRTLLSSYVWVDDVERFNRLGRALAVARDVPATVVQQDAGEFVESLDLAPGMLTVLWHSAMWVYLQTETKARVLAGIDELSAHASDEQPFAHVSWEWSESPVVAQSAMPFELAVRVWSGRPDDGRRRILAVGMSHGHPLALRRGTD